VLRRDGGDFVLRRDKHPGQRTWQMLGLISQSASERPRSFCLRKASGSVSEVKIAQKEMM